MTIPNASSLTVIIPTFNRRETVRRALDCYTRQSVPSGIAEILLIDDGSTDGTDSLASKYEGILPLRYFRTKNRGPASARNLGVSEARSDLLLFTDDDIFPDVTLVEQHLKVHSLNPDPSVVVQGVVDWDPELMITPFMRWYGSAGALFGFGRIRDRENVDFRHFYTCNLSLKRSLLRQVGYFNETFPCAAYEDTELAFRLKKKGMRLLFEPRALAYHHQTFTFNQACARGKRVARGLVVFKETEAGRFVRESSDRSKMRMLRTFTRVVAPLLIPCVPILDSTIPLPHSVYRALYWYYTNRE